MTEAAFRIVEPDLYSDIAVSAAIPPIFYPRTLSDFEKIDVWIAQGLSNRQILDNLTNQLWRTQLYELGADLFCPVCSQIHPPHICDECGQAVWRLR